MPLQIFFLLNLLLLSPFVSIKLVWWHVDDLSSAHVYLRQKPGETLNDISPGLLLDCASLVKANSIEGCKKSQVYVVYTRWKNLKKTSNMGKKGAWK
jgi:hypothetical protein